MKPKSPVKKLPSAELKKLADELENEARERENERYWCPYCGRPLNVKRDYVRGWNFQSPKGGALFNAKIYKCHQCNKKVRVTRQLPGTPLKDEEKW